MVVLKTKHHLKINLAGKGEKVRWCVFTYLFMCVFTYMYVCRHVCYNSLRTSMWIQVHMFAYVYRQLKLALHVFLRHSLFYWFRQYLSLNPELLDSGFPWWPCLCLWSVAITGSHHSCLAAMWVLTIETLSLMYVWQPVYPMISPHSHGRHIFIFKSIFYFGQQRE